MILLIDLSEDSPYESQAIAENRYKQCIKSAITQRLRIRLLAHIVLIPYLRRRFCPLSRHVVIFQWLSLVLLLYSLHFLASLGNSYTTCDGGCLHNTTLLAGVNRHQHSTLLLFQHTYPATPHT